MQDDVGAKSKIKKDALQSRPKSNKVDFLIVHVVWVKLK